ncbi:universal stress protein [Nocardia sp. NPDC004068]|uniref:universal stress protein n=1 Tax=Nocardia sp. NPDC004068 TaxID=3364303 RepID=UPI0036D10574
MAEHGVPQRIDSDTIVAAVDGSAVSYHAVGWAAAEAALYGRALHLIASVYVHVPAGWGPGVMLSESNIDDLHADGERIVTEATRVARAAAPDAVAITTAVTFDPIIPVLLEQSGVAAMIVVGSRGHGALRRGLLGSVSTAVTRHAHCPVTVVRGWSPTDPVAANKPVLVGVDGSENSVPAIELAFEAASRRKVGVTALHAWSDAAMGREVPIIGWDDVLHERAAADFSASLAGWSEQYPEVPVRRILVPDRPVRALLEAAEDAQLVVVGSHGRGGFTGMLLGSTSAALAQSVDCPITIVRKR